MNNFKFYTDAAYGGFATYMTIYARELRSFEEETFEDSAWLYSMSFIALIYLAISLKLFSVTNNRFVRVTFN